MKAILKKTLLVALPLAGLLLAAPAAFARSHHDFHRHDWGYEDDYYPSYGRHGWDDRWRYEDNYYGRRGWDDRWRYDDYSYGRGGRYGGRYYDYDDDYRSRYPQPFYSDQPWWYSWMYR